MYLVYRAFKRRRFGFSMIEMMGVAIILGMFALIIGPQVYNNIRQSRLDATLADLKAIGDALEIYGIRENTFPGEDWKVKLEEKGYIKSVGQDKWGQDWGYCQPNRGVSGSTTTPPKNGGVFSKGPSGDGNLDCESLDPSGDTDKYNLYYIIKVTPE